MSGRVLKSRLLAGAGLVALIAAGSASAAPTPPAPMPATWSWSGFYLGAHGGYGWARDPMTDAIFGNKSPQELSDVNSHGWLGGFQAGANWQAGSWVGGLELDLSATGIKGSSSASTGTIPITGSAPPQTLSATATQTDKFDSLGSLRARLGYLPWPNVLFYGTGGPAWTRLVQTLDETILLTAAGIGSEVIAGTSSSANWRFGAVAGVGAETRLGDSNWLARIEYLHYDFGKADSFVGTNAFEPTTSGSLRADVVRGGLSYKFGQDSAFGSASASYASAVMPVKAPRVAAWTWSGFYIGGHGGYGWGSDPFTSLDNGFDGNITLTDISSNGLVGGFQAGGNWQMGAWVGGLELDLSASGIRGSNSVTVPTTGGTTGTDNITETDQLELLGSARARVGYLAWPDVLLYGTGGLAWTRLVQTTDETTVITSGGTSSASSSAAVDWQLGWVAGIGAETRLWNTNWLARIEYLHYDFGDSGSSFDNTGVTFTSGHLTADVVRGGLSYKFDWSGAAAAPVKVAMPVKARPAIVARSDWGGFYLGGHAGYGWGRDPISESLVSTLTGFGGTDPLFHTGISSAGFVAGFQAGANRQMGAWVGGLEIDLSATGIKGSTTNIDADADSSETNTDKFDMLGSARARLGYLAWTNVLFYGTGGLAWTRLNESSLDVSTGVSGSTFPVWEFGWVAGAGGETRLWNSDWFLRLEYLHYDFGKSRDISQTISANTIFATGTAVSTSTTGDLTTDVVRTALSFKFN